MKRHIRTSLLRTLIGMFLLLPACDGTGAAPETSSLSRADEGETCFIDTARLNAPHSAHTATLLPDGRVLIVGGSRAPFSDYVRDATSIAELYDPVPSTFRLTGSLNTARALHTATHLNDGRVLVAGGQQGGTRSFASIEIYDPSSGAFTRAGNMISPRQAHTATLLNDGRVLIMGGYDGTTNTLLASAEIYDPRTATFFSTGSMTYRRQLHSAVRQADGTVLVMGGIGGAGPSNAANPLTAVEIYDPATGRFRLHEPLTRPLFLAESTRLPDQSVLLSGGAERLYAQGAANAGTWKVTYLGDVLRWYRATSTPRILHSATLLTDGSAVLLAGGSAQVQGYAATDSAELIDPLTQDSIPAPSMLVRRKAHTATLLITGEVLMVGGYNQSGNVLEAELYLP